MGHFNHNDHYHRFLLRRVPANCARALDVGCGSGTFARALAARSAEVDAIDRSAEMIASATGPPNVHFVHADVREYELGSYDFVSCVASLHHLPFAETVVRLRDALRPGASSPSSAWPGCPPATCRSGPSRSCRTGCASRSAAPTAARCRRSWTPA
jgi:2-polyprenyl-3-methyl-5-hydroxy-6-metoxy-1,4-benzoquinol methylase